MSTESNEPPPRKPLSLVRKQKAEDDAKKPVKKTTGEQPPSEQSPFGPSAEAGKTPPTETEDFSAEPVEKLPEEEEQAPRPRLTLKRSDKAEPAAETEDVGEEALPKPPPLKKNKSSEPPPTFAPPDQAPSRQPGDLAEELEEPDPLAPPESDPLASIPPTTDPPATDADSGPSKMSAEESAAPPQPAADKLPKIETEEPKDGDGEKEKPPLPPSGNELAAAKTRQIRNGILLSVALLAVFVGGGYAIYWILVQDSGSTAVTPAQHQEPRIVESTPEPQVTATPIEQAAEAIEAATQSDAVEEILSDTITATSEEPTIAIIGRPLDEASGPDSGDPATAESTESAASSASPSSPATEPDMTTPRVLDPSITEQMVSDYIARLEIGGVRSSRTDPRATINGQHYRKDSTINERMGLRFIGAQDSTLMFEDVNGRVYRRRF